jgi:hypothetical protein
VSSHEAYIINIVSKTDGYESCIRIYRKNSHMFHIYIQGVTGGKDLTSGECSLGQTIPI